MVKVTKILKAIDLDNKYSQTINNAKIDILKVLKLINIKKYQRYIS